MIPFLIKLSNLLDERGNYAMAAEVDDLITKFATIHKQALMPNGIAPTPSSSPESVYDASLAPVSRKFLMPELPQTTKEGLESIIAKIQQMAQVQMKEPSDDSVESAKQLSSSIKIAPSYENNRGVVDGLISALDKLNTAKTKPEMSFMWGEVWTNTIKANQALKNIATDHISSVQKSLILILNDLAKKAKQQSKNANVEDSKTASHEFFSAIYDSAEYKQMSIANKTELDRLMKALDFDTIEQGDVATRWNMIYKLTQDAINKIAPQNNMANKKPKQRANVQILEVQKLLGVKLSGIWDKITNSTFLTTMESLYPKYLKNGKFLGSLSKALELLRVWSANRGQRIPQQEDEGQAEQKNTQTEKAVAGPQYKSKYDLLDLKNEIGRLITQGKFKKEDIENLIGIATVQADKGGGNSATRQERFEKLFKQLGRRSVVP